MSAFQSCHPQKVSEGAQKAFGASKNRDDPRSALAAPVHTAADSPCCVRNYSSDPERRIRGFFCSVLTLSHTM